MKKNLFLVVMMAFAFNANAQKTAKNAVKINPLSLIAKTGNVSYERSLSAIHSVQISTFYTALTFNDLKYQGVGITPEFRFYLSKEQEALNGIYLAPFGRYQEFSLSQKKTNNKAAFTSFGGGATLGWQKIWNNGLLLNLFAGPSYNDVKFKNGSREEDFDIHRGFSSFGLRTGLSLGFTF